MTDPNWRRKPKYWTNDRLFELSGLLDLGWSDARIGRHFGKTAEAIKLARRKHHLAPRAERYLSSQRVASLMNISCSKTVIRWIEMGYLKGKRGVRIGLHRTWMVEWDDLFDFLRDPAHWHRWEVSRIGPDSPLWWACADARGHHATERYLTLSEVARRFFVQTTTVCQWIGKGQLPSVRNGNHLVRESDLRGWTPPSWQPRVNHHPLRYTAEEDALILAHPFGASWDAIAEQTGRTHKALTKRARILRRVAQQRAERAA
ncbi:MAG TPA: hypothetical protein VKU87_04380 [Thermomicrobiaceae bacterium]|nr:hypothetical protein [Thermomicrobiaceae bacterium]